MVKKEVIKKKTNKKKLESNLNKKEKLLLQRVIREKVADKANRVKKETKKQLLTALVAAFGFIMALEWREVISSYVDMIGSFSPIQGNLVSAIIVTIVAVLGILIVNKIFFEPEGN